MLLSLCRSYAEGSGVDCLDDLGTGFASRRQGILPARNVEAESAGGLIGVCHDGSVRHIVHDRATALAIV
ncbi:MAG: hypothetical protein LZF60_240008 [Nitrospira sp.]|nr:MAG: hypothetical protein LZF60_240008 [Nitrospira sp.]